jgi:dihydrofolate reductase
VARSLIYSVAASLDGFITAADGGVDWIPDDPEIDFVALFARFDTLVMGRGTYEEALRLGGTEAWMGMDAWVCSRTLSAADCPGLTVTDDAASTVRRLKAEPGKDLWLFGGGILFRSLLDEGLVDGVDVAVVPVLLGDGLPLVPPGTVRPVLRLEDQKTYSASGIVFLRYEVVRSDQA